MARLKKWLHSMVVWWNTEYENDDGGSWSDLGYGG
jgi:hypothetical protein